MIITIGKTKEFSKYEFARILLDNGFTFNRQKGSHYIYKRNNETIMINKDLNKMVARRLIKTYNLKF